MSHSRPDAMGPYSEKAMVRMVKLLVDTVLTDEEREEYHRNQHKRMYDK